MYKLFPDPEKKPRRQPSLGEFGLDFMIWDGYPASQTDFTGLIPANPPGLEAYESYEDLGPIPE